MSTIKTFAIVVVILIALIAVGWALKALLLPVFTVTSQIDSAGDIIDKTYDADNAIYNYEWFKYRYEEIEATEIQISNTKQSMDSYRELYGNASDWDWQAKKDYNSLSTVYLGQQNYYETIVAEYNARSKMANREIFSDKLPLSVDKMVW
jgi:hypothetical protein